MRWGENLENRGRGRVGMKTYVPELYRHMRVDSNENELIAIQLLMEPAHPCPRNLVLARNQLADIQPDTKLIISPLSAAASKLSVYFRVIFPLLCRISILSFFFSWVVSFRDSVVAWIDQTSVSGNMIWCLANGSVGQLQCTSVHIIF